MAFAILIQKSNYWEYFENVEDGGVSWSIPEGGVLEDDVLPEGWKRLYSEEDNKYYYENEEEDRRVWDEDEINGEVVLQTSVGRP